MFATKPVWLENLLIPANAVLGGLLSGLIFAGWGRLGTKPTVDDWILNFFHFWLGISILTCVLQVSIYSPIGKNFILNLKKICAWLCLCGIFFGIAVYFKYYRQENDPVSIFTSNPQTVYLTFRDQTNFGPRWYGWWHNQVWQLKPVGKTWNETSLYVGQKLLISGTIALFEYGINNNHNYALTAGVTGTMYIRDLLQIQHCDWFCNLIHCINRFRESQLALLQKHMCIQFGSDWQYLTPFDSCSDIYALSAGLTFGGNKSFSPEVRIMFQKTGLSHIVAISGFNITIIISVLSFILAKIRLSFKYWLPVLTVFISFFVLLVGFSPSVVRAAVMGLIITLAHTLGRPCSGLRSLLLSACILLWTNPLYIASVSFQLSFLATLGLLVFFEPEIQLESGFLKSLGEIVCGTATANLFVLPVLVNVFGYFSPFSFLPNLLVLPFVPWLMLFNLLALLPFAGFLFAFVAGLIQAWLLGLIQLLAAALPNVYLAPFTHAEICLWYGFLIGLSVILRRKLIHF